MDSKEWILIDYDDTLGGVLIDGEIVNNELAYEAAISRYENLLNSIGLDGMEAKTLLHDLDMELCTNYGFSYRNRFRDSMKMAYIKYCNLSGKEWRNDIVLELSHIGESVFQHPYLPLPGALDVLNKLGLRHNIAVVTKGHFEEQAKKVKDSGIVHSIDAFYPVSKKNLTDWEYVVRDLGIKDLASTWAIGNSPKSDVNVPLEMGMNAIWVKQGRWVFEHEPIVQGTGKFHEVCTITEVLNHINWKK